jgi:hypothetical protein
MSPRLWVKSITSVGAVEEGDNPGAEILFWKARDPDTGEGFGKPRERGVQRATSDAQPRERRIAERRTRKRRYGPDRRNRTTELVAKAIRQHREVQMPANTTTETLSEACVGVVQKAAHEILLKDFGSRRGLTEAEIRAKLWRSDDGKALRELMNSSEGKRPATEAISEIRKSKYADHFAHGLSVLRDGL